MGENGPGDFTSAAGGPALKVLPYGGPVLWILLRHIYIYICYVFYYHDIYIYICYVFMCFIIMGRAQNPVLDQQLPHFKHLPAWGIPYFWTHVRVRMSEGIT